MALKVHPPSTDSRLWKSGSGHRPMRMRTIAVKRGVPMDSVSRLYSVRGASLVHTLPRTIYVHGTDTCTCPSTGDGFVKP